MAAGRRPILVLLILDGWGRAPDGVGNAIASCPTDFMRELEARHPSTLLTASGEAVGLPEGVMGNSEVGHLTIGAGRTVFQDVTRINLALGRGELEGNAVLARGMDAAAGGHGTLHFMGLCSDASVHSHLDHLKALVRMAAGRKVPRVRVHAFTDGRDTPPDSGRGYISDLAAFLARTHPDAALATVGGRYWGMDRDGRWERVEKHWQALVRGQGRTAPDPVTAVTAAYERGETDEFIEPTVIQGVPDGAIQDGDGVIFFNFRPDRARQMTRALTDPDFDGFPRPAAPHLASYTCLTRYDESFDLPVAFPPDRPDLVMGRLLAERDLTQLRIAETEKYAHVTYFLNGGVERTYAGEDRILVPSPRVATYDLQPEMSAPDVRDRLIGRIKAGSTDVIVGNFANADMVGHTGLLEPTVKACEVVDRAVGAIADAARACGALLAVTADHGNAEQMIDPHSGGPHTAHTTNPVPLILAREDLRGARLHAGGGLASILPTILTALEIPCPGAMDGGSLL